MSEVADEIWKDIPGYEGYYQASNLGRIKSLARISAKGSNLKEKILKQSRRKDGYLQLRLWKNATKKVHLVHRLVLYAFVGQNDLVCNHLDGIKSNNIVTNLEFTTSQKNIIHAIDTGLRKCIGIKHYKAVLQDEQVIDIYNDGRPYKEIQKDYNISDTLICHIKSGKRRRFLTKDLGGPNGRYRKYKRK